jgi:hypothetical protein
MIVPGCIWTELAEEGRYDTISLLHRVERHEFGYGTVIVKPEGFSDYDCTHNDILDWLVSQGVNVLNPGLEITRMERALQ